MVFLYLILAGIMTAISPCPLASNVAAISFICRNMDSHRRAAAASICYTLGRILSYIILGALIGLGLPSAPGLSLWLQEALPLYMGPVLIICGLVVLECINLPSIGRKPTGETVQKLGSSLPGSFLLGALFAMALCPPSAAIFFGTALPLASESGSWAWLGISIFGLGTALPVVFFAMLIVCSTARAATAMKCLPTVQKWSRNIAGILLFLLGSYLTITELII